MSDFQKPESELIPDKDNVYRQVHKNFMKKNSNLPSAKEFRKKADEEGISVNWDKYVSPQEVLQIIGKTYKKGSEDFKDPGNYHLFQLNVGEVRAIESVKDVLHDPIWNDPELVGNPNNFAHSLIILEEENDTEFRLKIAEMLRNSACMVT